VARDHSYLRVLKASCRGQGSVGGRRSDSLLLGVFLNLVGGLLVLLTDFVKLLHVIEELGAALKSNE